MQTHSCKYVHETLAFSSLIKVYIKVTYFIIIMQIISFLYFEELIPKVTEYGFFINIYLKQYAYQCLLKRKPNYTNLKVIQEYDTFFFIIVTCLFCDDYYGCIKSDCSCWTSFSNSTDYKCSRGLHV